MLSLTSILKVPIGDFGIQIENLIGYSGIQLEIHIGDSGIQLENHIGDSGIQGDFQAFYEK